MIEKPETAHLKAAHAQDIARDHSFDAHMDRFDRALADLGLT